jgi:hypothetical protein
MNPHQQLYRKSDSGCFRSQLRILMLAGRMTAQSVNGATDYVITATTVNNNESSEGMM